MTDRGGRGLAALVAAAALAAPGCGKVEKLEQPIRPSLEVFASQAQPVFERQGCSRTQCHGKVPEGVGGLKLAQTDNVLAEDPDVLANYVAATAFIDLGEPDGSVLVRAPFLGTGGEVDHPEYYGRFSTATDCCYCSVLLWICEDGDSDECQACRKTDAPNCDCTQALYCELDEAGAVTPAEGATLTWPNTIGPLLQQETTCAAAGCHGLDPASVCPNMFDVGQVVREDNPCDGEDDEAWMTRCQPGGGTFVQYAIGLGRGADEIHPGKLNTASADTVVQWVSDLGAPGEPAVVGPGPDPDPDPDPDPGPVYVCDPASPAADPDVPFDKVRTWLEGGGCSNCHGGAQPQVDLFSRDVLLAEGVVVPCDATSSLISESTTGAAQVPQHFQGKWRATSPQIKDITRWIVDLGAPP